MKASERIKRNKFSKGELEAIQSKEYFSESYLSQLNDEIKSLGAWKSQEEIAELRKKFSTIIVDLYRSNDTSVQTKKLFESVNSAKSYLDKISETYSQYSSAEEFNKYSNSGWLDTEAPTTQETVSLRQEKYQDNASQLKDIDEELPWYGKTWLPNFIEDIFLSDDKETLRDKAERLEAENKQYERSQKAVDDNYMPITDEVTQIASNRSYTNATKEELRGYDSNFQEISYLLSDGVHHIDENTGNIVNSVTHKVAYSADEYTRALLDNNQSGFYNRVVEDKLGMFLAAEKDGSAYDYVSELASTNGSYTHTWGNIMQEGDVNAWKHLSEDEITIYYYKLNTEGQESAYKFLEDMSTELTRRETQKRADDINDAPLLEQIALNIASIPMSVIGGATGIVEDAVNMFQGKDINPYSRAHMFSNDSSVIREDTALDINKLTGNVSLPWVGTTFGDVYQALMSGADSFMASFIPGGHYLLGLNAASSAMKDVYDRGGSTTQILSEGLLFGTAEALFEKYSIGELKKLKNMNTKSVKNFAEGFVRATIMGGVEASEEMATEIANTITDAVVMGSQSNWEDFETFAKNVVNAGIGGLVSGGAMGAIAAKINNAEYNAKVANHGRDIINEGGVDTLKQLALDMAGANQNKEGQRLANLVGKAESKPSAKNIGKLSVQVGDTIVKQNSADIQKALIKRGLSEKDAKRVAEYLGSSNALTAEQKAEIEGNENIKAVYDELLDNSKSTISERGRKLVAARLGTKIDAENSGELSLKNDVDIKGRISETGKTTLVDTGEEVTIDKNNPIARVKYVDGERVVYFNTDHGTVEASKVKYANEKEGLLYEAFADMNPAFANAVIKNYDGSVPIQTYINGMREGMILYGMHNFQAVGKDISKNSFLSDLSEADQAFALKLGRAYAKADAKKASKDLRSAIKKAAEKTKASEGASSSEATQNKPKKGNVYFEDGAKAETHKQHRKIIALAKHLAKAIGIDIVFYDSRITGKKAGQGANGYFDADTDTIYLDLQNAKDDAKTIAYTLSHELVHFIKKWSPQKFNTFAEFLMEQYASHGVSAASLLKQKMVELNTTDADYAYEEMIADACETMLLDSNAMVKLMELRKSDLELFEKIKLHVLKILNDIREAYRKLGYEPSSDEAKALLKMKDVLEQFYSMFEEAVVDATQNYQELGTEGYNELVAKSTKNANKTVFGEASVDVGTTESGVKHQLKAHKAVGEASIAYNERHKKVHKAILQVGIESMYEMAEVMLPYLEKEGILPPDIPGKTIFKNGSYGKTGENTTLCVRTLTYEDFKDRVAEKVGRPLTVSESLLVSQKIYDIATEPQCIYCYVAADRKAYDEYLGEYWKAMDKYIKAMRKGGDSKALYTEYLAGRKDTDAQKKRWSQWEAIAKSGKEYISASDLTTKRKRDGIIARKNAFSDQIKDAQRYAQSASWAKTVCDYRAYKGDILKMTSAFVDLLNSEYGLRMYSFSDYTPAFIVENMQMIIDASVKGLKSLAYTKDTDYVEIFASTGQAINVSCFAKWDAESGTYVEDNRQGANWEKTKNLRKQYRNVGAVMVATNDAMVEWALKQDWVDVVIPYHIVKTGTTIANEYQWNNYTSESSDKIGNRGANIYPTEHNNDFATYSDLLKERGITPRFSRWYDMVASGELTEEQYMKLVNEVRLPASELSPVIPSFNLEAAKKSFGIDNKGKVIKDGFVDKGGYMGGWYRQGVDVNQEVMAVSEDIEAGTSSLNVDYGMSKAGKERVEQRYKRQAKKKMTVEEQMAGEKLADFIDSVSLMLDQSKISKRKLKIGVLSDAHKKIVEELMHEINPSFSATGYELWIDGTGADHIIIRHGVNGQHDSTMATREDRELIPWAANSPDGGEFIRDESGKLMLSNRFFNADDSKAPQIRIHKMVDGDTMYVSECVLDSKNKRIYITSAYKELADKQKGSTNQLLNIDSNEPPQPTSETSFDGSATKGSVSHPNDSVKNNSENSQNNSNEHQQKKSSDRILMGSLFSGGGTLEAGLTYQMLDKQFGVEYDGKIASVYADNHGDHIQVGRVEDFDISKYDDIFYLHASPVCHNFSKAKHGATELQMDIDSAKATAKHLETAMPQVFTVENAPGYLKSQSLKIITDKLTKLGYKWDVDIYNSADYGSATSRNRVILRAVKDGELPSKPTKQDRTNSWDKVTRDLWDSLPKATLRPSFISAIENTPKLPILDANGKVNVNKPLLILTTTSGHMVTYCWEGEICPTLTTKCGEARLVMPDGNIYAVTPEFMGRIQGLPDDYKYPKEKTRAFTIIGNGIPTHLTKAVVGGVLDSAYEQTHEGRILFQKKRNPSSYAPTFYSQMGREIDAIKMDKIGATSLVNYLKGKGIKNDEIKWSGIEAFLEGKKSVTKAELQEFIVGSQLVIEEEMVADEQNADIVLWQSPQANVKVLYIDGKPEDIFRKNEYGNWVSDEFGDIFFDEQEILEQVKSDYARNVANTKWSQYKLDGGTNYRELVFKMPNSSYSNNAMRVHWGEDAEGVLVHARIQDFNVNGKKMLFIEEIQSDWHNEGHSKGYSTKEYEDAVATYDDLYSKYQKHDLALSKYIRSNEFMTDPEDVRKKKFDWLRNKVDAAQKKYIDANKVVNSLKENGAGDTPDAPFRDTYHEYVLKRLLRMATEEGYDSIGWTPAYIQSDRWSEEFAEGYRIEYDQEMPKFLRKYGKKWGATVGKTTIEGNGKTTYTSDGGVKHNSIREWFDSTKEALYLVYGDHLKGKLIVKEDGNTLYVENKETGERYPSKLFVNEGNQEVWSMDITDSMTESVLYEGQPKFQKKKASNRTLLANALETTAQNDIERTKLTQYKEKIALIESEEEKLAELRGKIKELSFAKGARDTAAIKKLQFEAKQAENRINTYDRQLLNLESTTALKGVLEREKQKAYQRAEMKGKEALEAYREKMTKTQRELLTRYQDQRREQRERAIERKDKTTLRRKIRKVVKDLNSLLKNGNKKRNIKEEMQDTVASSLALAEVLFNDDIKNEDIVRLGVASVTTKESEYLNKYRDLLDERDSLQAKIESIYANGNVKETIIAEVAKVTEELDKVNGRIAYLNNKLSDLFERERARLNRATVDAIIDELVTEYSRLEKSENNYIKNAFNEGMKKRLEALKESLQGKIARDMDVNQLSELYDTFKAIEHMIRHSNNLFREGRTEDLMTYVSNMQGEIYEASTEQKDRNAVADTLESAWNEFTWNNLRPVDAVERLGSETFEKLFWDFVHGMGVAARDIKEAGEVIAEAREKFGYSNWDMELADTPFTTRDGMTFKPSLADKLSIYAYSKREQAEDHMVDGGFTYDTGITYKETENGKTYVRRKLSNTYRLSKENIQSVIDSLTDEQRAYVDAILPYLTDMGKKGNEVSMTLYGIELFGEKVYFPLQSSRDYLSSTTQTLGATPTMASLANSGFTNQTKPHANNPIVLRGFDDVVLEHIEKMSNYHALVIPIENLRRVFDNVGRETEGMPISTKALIGSRFGVEAQKYFEQWLTDINGGVMPSGAKSFLGKLFSRAKGMSVAANLSVVAQQYFSIIRAMELVDPKYFAPFLNGEAKQTDMKQYEELLKYAPIAIIKEMGGFDVGSSGRVKDYIGYEGARKDAKYINKKIDDISMWGAGKMDELGWVTIWKAVKAEVASEQKLTPGTEEFYEACRIRFTEVVTKTQVFDSVASRSGYMRSQHDAVKYATSFMGEPTAIVGRIFGAGTNLVRAYKSGNKARKKSAWGRFSRTATVIVTSGVLGKLAVALVYAGRDDDEDEALLEKWARNFAEALKDDLNILNSLPFGRDIVSVIEGWDVERPDMTLIADLVTSSKKMLDGDITFDDSLGLIGSIGNFFGKPLKNVIREIRSAINVVGDITDDVQPTDMGGAFVEGWTGDERTKGEMLYEAMRRGDYGRIEAIKATYEDEESANTALRKYIGEIYKSGEISYTEAMNALVNYGGYDKNKAYWKLREWDFDIENGEDAEYSKYTEFYEAVKTGRNIKAVIKEYTDQGVKPESLASQITRYYKPIYKAMSNAERAGIKGYLLNAYALLGYNRYEKSKDIDKWLED